MRKSEMGTVPPGASGSYTPTINLSFVGQEYWGCDDEIVGSRDGLHDDFGGDNYCVTRNALYLGLTREDDGCEPLEEETEAEAMDRYLVGIEDEGDDEYVYSFVRDQDKARVAEAVAEALALQEFFRRKAESKPAEKKAETRYAYAESYTLPEPEVVEVWQMRRIWYNYGGGWGSTVRPGKNSRRPWIGNHGGDKSQSDSERLPILAEVVVNNRRYRVSRAA